MQEKNNLQSASNGKLTKFQEHLVIKYQNLIKLMEDKAESYAKQSNIDLQNRMNQFLQIKAEVINNRNEILNCMGTSDKSFDELRLILGSSKIQLQNEMKLLHNDAISMYDASFESLKPFIEKAFQETKDISAQLPDYAKGKLEQDVQRLNTKYLETKKVLLQTLAQIEINLLDDCDDAEEQFDEKSNVYHESHFMSLLNDIKLCLNLEKPIDYSSLCQKFYTDEQKFIQCITKQIQGINIILPPENFSPEELDIWWEGCKNIMIMHNSFITQFQEKFKEKTDSIDAKNKELVEQLEKDCANLRPDSTALTAFTEIQPLLTVSQKCHQDFYERICKYWTNRTEAIQKSLQSIYDFFKPLITLYYQFLEGVKVSENKADAYRKELMEKSNLALIRLEEELSLKIGEIETLIDQKEITARVNACKDILNRIEKEYRLFHENAIEGYSKLPVQVGDLFQLCESKTLELLKMEKTVDNPDLITSVASQKGKQTKKGLRRSHHHRGKGPSELEVPKISFNFSISNGAKFEETSPLIVIPPTEAFLENGPPSTPASSRRGKQRGKAPVQRAKRGARGKAAQEPPEIEIPHIPLLQNIFQIDGKPSIYLFVPENDIIKDFINVFREKLVISLHFQYSEAANKALHEEDKINLTDELNERLRTHSPRANGIELNTAQQRIMSVEARRLKLQKFFINFSAQFNKSLTQLHESVSAKMTSISDRADKIRHFLIDLTKIQASREFAQLHHFLDVESEAFVIFRKEQLEQQNNDINSFRSHYENLIKRFVESYNASPGSEDSAMCKAVVDRVNEQIKLLLDASISRESTIVADTDLIITRTKEEFELNMPYNIYDVKFLENLAQTHSDAVMKYNALVFRSNQTDDELQNIVNLIGESRNLDLDYQKKIAKLIEAIDKARVAFVARAKYLGCLKSIINEGPIVFVLDLTKADSLTGNETAPSTFAGSNRPPSRSSKSRNSSSSENRKKSASKSSSGGTRSRSAHKKGTEAALIIDNDSLISQINSIGLSLNQAIVQAANEYFNQIKARKFPTTRPEQIPATVNEIADMMKTQWNETISNAKHCKTQSTMKLTKMLNDAIESSKLSVEMVFDLFKQFSFELNDANILELQKKFDEKMNEYLMQRNENKSKLNPVTADENNVQLLNQLIVDERSRSKEESKSVDQHKLLVVQQELNEMKLFISNLIVITNALTNIFDNFLFIEDISVKKKIESKKRLSTSELLREQKRQQQNPTTENGRPFRSREWNQLDLIMESIKKITSEDEMLLQQQLLMQQQLNATNSSTAQNASKRTTRGKRKSDKAGATINQGDKEKTPLQRSLETPVHRFVMILRNKIYGEYEKTLTERITKFNDYIRSLKGECTSFDKHFETCILSIKPNADLNIDLPVSKKEKRSRSGSRHQKKK